MSLPATHLDLLLVHADDRAPVIAEGVDADAAARAPTPTQRPRPPLLWNESAEAGDLVAQRWGVIAPAGERGERLLSLIAPLIEHRRAQQNIREVTVYRVPARMDLSEAARWKKRVFRRDDDLDDELPRYQLVLGDLDEVPLAVQQVQATDGFVGRLAFDREDDYRAYVDKVVRWERQPSSAARAELVMHTVHDGSAATRRGHDALMAPGVRILERRRSFGQLSAGAIRATGAQPPSLDDLWQATGGHAPSVLMTMSHGIGAPRGGWRSAEHQRRDQGALSFGDAQALHAELLRERAFLPGGAWLAVACFGAGTAESSDYYHWLDTLRGVGHVGRGIEHVLDTLARERPFIAALPKAALASPEGPLAFIGHVDLAWAYSFYDLGDQAMRRPGRLMGVLQSLLRGDRAGVAMRALLRFFQEVNTELSALYDADARTQRRELAPRALALRSHLWMLRQDLAGYLLLGDPAVRLPLSPPAALPGDAPTTAQEPAPRPRARPQPASVRADEIDQAVCAILGGADPAAFAGRLRMSGDELASWTALYRAAGHRALVRALGDDDDGPRGSGS